MGGSRSALPACWIRSLVIFASSRSLGVVAISSHPGLGSCSIPSDAESGGLRSC